MIVRRFDWECKQWVSLTGPGIRKGGPGNKGGFVRQTEIRGTKLRGLIRWFY